MSKRSAAAVCRRMSTVFALIERARIPAALLLLLSARLGAGQDVQLVPDRLSYNAGDTLQLKVVVASEGSRPSQRGTPSPAGRPVDLAVTIRYAGSPEAVVSDVELAKSFVPATGNDSPRHHTVWRVPADATTGRYEVELQIRHPQSRQILSRRGRAASFVVHRKLVRIERIELDKTFYTPGDPVACQVVLKNVTERQLAGLRVEFSDRYWPWIAPSGERSEIEIFPVMQSLSLRPGATVEVRSPRAAVAKPVEKPAVHQYVVIVWDKGRKNIYDIAFSPVVFIRPPGSEEPKPYPLQYVYRGLKSVDTSSYRQFDSGQPDSPAIQFDRGRTMFAPGSEAAVRFTVRNPTETPWRGVSVRAELRALGSAGFAQQVVVQKLDLGPNDSTSSLETTFILPSDEGGLYRAVVRIADSSGQTLASNQLEIAANPLPKSLLIFCAHEDDEMAHAGLIRAAVENRIPLNIVYFTSGDAGSCDRYYQRSCGPEEALNFGGLRMEEARAALGHLGVPGENIHFLGLPDGGSGQVWYDHIEPTSPYLAALLACDHAPYEGVVQPNLPYARKSVVTAVKGLIRKFQPEVVLTAHPPSQGHIDHIVNNYFVVKALQELRREGMMLPETFKILVDRVYDPETLPSTPYQYQEHVFHVSGEAAARAQEARWFYQSQGGNRAQGAIRRFSELPRATRYRELLDWKEHEGWNETIDRLSD